jgi:hypothetical protein
MSQLQSKQVFKLVSGWIRVSGFTASGTSGVVTTVVTNALSTAGEGGVSVPLQDASASQVGVLVSGNNRVEIYDATTKLKIKDLDGNEVYGRLTSSSNVYTLTYYVLVNGVETSYSFTSTSIDFEFIYRFDFERVPPDFAVTISTRNVAQDPSGSGGTVKRESLAVTGTNTINSLTKTPLNGVTLLVNGQGESSAGSPAPFTVSGKAITWSASNAGYSLATTDKVVAVYETNE